MPAVRLAASTALAALALHSCGPGRGAAIVHALPEIPAHGADIPRAISPWAAGAFLEGEIALASQDPAAAIQAFTLALTSEPGEPLITVRLAAAHLAAGDADRAAALLQAVLDADPAFEPALVLLGDVSLATGDAAGAVSWYWSAIEAEPAEPAAYMKLVEVAVAAGDTESALDAALALVAADPSNAEAHLIAADLCLDLGLVEEAYAHMESHLATVPVDPATVDRYASVLGIAARLVEDGESGRAIFLYEVFLGMFPGDVGAIEGLARALVAAGDTWEAREVIGTIPEPGAGAPSGTRLLEADLLLEAGAPDMALASLESAFGGEAATLPPDARSVWIQALARTHDFAGAKQGIGGFGPIEGAFHSTAVAVLASEMASAGLFAEAWDLLDAPGTDLEACLDSREARRALLALLLRTGDDALASDVRDSLRSCPAGRLVLAEEMFWSTPAPAPGPIVETLAAIEGSAAGDGIVVDALALRATCIAEGVCKGKPTDMLSIISRMEDMEPASPALPAIAGMFALSAGNLDRAKANLDLADVKDPAGKMVKVWLAVVAIAAGDPESAGPHLTAAFLMGPPPYVLARILDLG